MASIGEIIFVTEFSPIVHGHQTGFGSMFAKSLIVVLGLVFFFFSGSIS